MLLPGFGTTIVVLFFALLAHHLLHEQGLHVDRQLVLDHLPLYAGEIRWFPSARIGILSEKGNDRAFLFVGKARANGDRWLPSPRSSWESHCPRGTRRGHTPAFLRAGFVGGMWV